MGVFTCFYWLGVPFDSIPKVKQIENYAVSMWAEERTFFLEPTSPN